MKQAYIISRGTEELLGMEHGEVEGLISREGTELMRRLLQGHLDVRAVTRPTQTSARRYEINDARHSRRAWHSRRT